MNICSRPRHHAAVLAGVKAKPFGWPAASPDPVPGGTHAVIESSRQIQDQIQLRGVSTVRGDCRSSPTVGGEDVEDRLLYRVTEVAVFLNVSRSKVYELLASGDLRSVKIDRTRLVRGSDLRDYVESLRPVA